MKSCETLERMLKLSEKDREKTGKVVARTFYKLLRQNGFTHPEIMIFTGNILDEVMKDISMNGKDKTEPVEINNYTSPARTDEVA